MIHTIYPKYDFYISKHKYVTYLTQYQSGEMGKSILSFGTSFGFIQNLLTKIWMDLIFYNNKKNKAPSMFSEKIGSSSAFIELNISHSKSSHKYVQNYSFTFSDFEIVTYVKFFNNWQIICEAKIIKFGKII